MSTAHASDTIPTTVDNANLQELEDTVSRLASHKGVQSVMILNRAGDMLVSRQAGPEAAKFAKQLLETASAYLTSLSEDDEISFLQIRSKQHRELMIAPHEGYLLAVLKR
ncbi:roadblock-related dynein light chain [Phaeodactylum tricornutum CCAP 1055/1]|jgi:hypothetical protein|uniref:Roadblock-related dynein light chain n=1 Tax=Phaeodactylum tricornutum (strain CCAP 1055/1) TaxID=556484 RepID=B7G1W1_PHATC|nr:roadblock-related dynein light chain [Phaeodactylum tricornutum CCAP 1055/1]EEC47755.1 roadblock-related dynein light chain [Phaeodactylum tricornutum CCAP 1055/1]|eukprot:XP_002181103.1 roadblock-related dynein light chain [Phaeodactylum tricornutum CCAP 1055/1]